MKNLRIDGDRLWQSLMEMAAFGPGDKGGNRRLALSDEDKAGRDCFVRWCEAAGCTVTVDEMGNIFARRAGRNDALPPVAAGSHLDTQPHGGKFDGVYGVLAGLEVIRTLNDHGIETEAPIEVVVWTNEEGARFAPAMMGSGAFAGVLDLAETLARTDVDGATVGGELARIGYAGAAKCGDHPIGAFFEVHIEQGPILEREAKTIGVVSGAQGLRWIDVSLAGRDSHAGTTPMDARRDALLGAARMVEAINTAALAHAPDGVGTVGEMRVSPNSRNTIPGGVDFTIDLRHPQDGALTSMADQVRAACAKIAAELDLALDLREVSHIPALAFDEGCIVAVREAADGLGYEHRPIVSGAGHDACYVARVAPTGMVFIPCADGLSHNEEESAEPDDLAAGCNVLMHAMLSRAAPV
ncbi:MAG: Zn-dependent hydrolase [Alphaproteobacteria bacterium]|nr:Zn-dependent hydrolase [Alphaproteobacteria bacterium]